MLLDRRWIEEHIPHKSGMCLLDEVLHWDLTQTQCRTSTHRSPDNPLRSNGRLGSACGIEYAAQTMAVHGALIASSTGRTAPPGFLASVRGVRLNIDRLDVFEPDLVTSVKRVAGDEKTALYEFSVSADNVVLVMGRAAIAFNVFAEVAPPVAEVAVPARGMAAPADRIAAPTHGAAASADAVATSAAGVATAPDGIAAPAHGAAASADAVAARADGVAATADGASAAADAVSARADGVAAKADGAAAAADDVTSAADRIAAPTNEVTAVAADVPGEHAGASLDQKPERPRDRTGR